MEYITTYSKNHKFTVSIILQKKSKNHQFSKNSSKFTVPIQFDVIRTVLATAAPEGAIGASHVQAPAAALRQVRRHVRMLHPRPGAPRPGAKPFFLGNKNHRNWRKTMGKSRKTWEKTMGKNPENMGKTMGKSRKTWENIDVGKTPNENYIMSLGFRVFIGRSFLLSLQAMGIIPRGAPGAGNSWESWGTSFFYGIN